MTGLFYEFWQDVPLDEWKWPNFRPYEIACHCDHTPKCKGHGSIFIVPYALDKLQTLRDSMGKPLKINSAYRSPEHNNKVGGSPKSKHVEGIAFDISLKGHNREKLTKAAEEVGFMGIGQYNTFIHVDARQTKIWWDYR